VALDVDRYRRDVGDATLKEEVLAAHVAAVDAFGVEAVPTIIVGETRLEGAASEADYRAALEAALRGAGRGR
jgi:predicted DsbA family dithiol-disulfide isomerase